MFECLLLPLLLDPYDSCFNVADVTSGFLDGVTPINYRHIGGEEDMSLIVCVISICKMVWMISNDH